MIDRLVHTVCRMFCTVPSTIYIISIFGFLPIETGRGDRLFIGVLSNIVFFLLWLGFVGDNFLIVATIIVVIWFFIVNKWG
jgi:predicted small integral membrane protein